MGAGSEFSGIVDLVDQTYVTFEGEQGREVRRSPIPDDLADEMELRRGELIEGLADHDDELAEMYLEGEEPTAALLHRALRRAVLASSLFPALSGSALKNAGVQPLLDAICAYLPSPLDKGAVEGHVPGERDIPVRLDPDPKAPLCALAFKIISDAHGDLTFARIYAGTLVQGKGMYNPRLARHERAGRVLRMHADEREAIETAGPG